MPLYEHVYLARQDVSAQQVEDLTKQFTSVIEGLGGKVTKNEYWRSEEHTSELSHMSESRMPSSA